MKKIQILLLTLLIPFLGHTQSSWIQIQLLTDDFPIETSWNILGAYGDTIIQNGILDINTLYDTIIEVEGDIVLNVVDASVGAHLYHFNVSDDISLNITPFSNFNNQGLNLSLNF